MWGYQYHNSRYMNLADQSLSNECSFIVKLNQSTWIMANIITLATHYVTLWTGEDISPIYSLKHLLVTSILGTLLGIPEKSKDSVNARLDMEDMGIRKSFNYCNMVGCTQVIYLFSNMELKIYMTRWFGINNLLSGLRTICFNHLGELCHVFVRKIGGHRIFSCSTMQTLVDIGQWFYFSVIGLIPCVDFQIRDNEVNIEDGMLTDENSFTSIIAIYSISYLKISIVKCLLFSSTFLAKSYSPNIRDAASDAQNGQQVKNTTKYGQQVKLILQICEFCFRFEHRSSPHFHEAQIFSSRVFMLICIKINITIVVKYLY
ncbi:hypothetical protein ACJX0J_019731 [Zea mays]